MDQGVTDDIQNIKQAWQIDVCKKLREVIHQAVPEADELQQWSKPHYKKNGEYLCNFFTAKEWVLTLRSSPLRHLKRQKGFSRLAVALSAIQSRFVKAKTSTMVSMVWWQSYSSKSPTRYRYVN